MKGIKRMKQLLLLIAIYSLIINQTSKGPKSQTRSIKSQVAAVQAKQPKVEKAALKAHYPTAPVYSTYMFGLFTSYGSFYTR